MFLLVPHEVTTTAATLWVAAVDEALPLNQLQLAPNMPGEMLPSNAGQWPRDAQQPRILHQEIVVSGLDPRRTYSFALMAGGRQLADAKVTTLPREMPLLGDKPFTVLLGSCFSRLEDKHGKVGSTFSQMRDDRPDIKILAGDQVYLDSPFEYFLAGTHTLAELHAKFVEQYTETWGRKGGLAALLKEGANFFCSDDHEFWNNAPNIAAHLLDTLPLIGKRDQWWKAARELYCAFQTGRPIQQFSVPPVSFLIADTRMNRSNKQTEFMLPADLESVGRWVDSLKGPSVLVIGQPLLQTSTGFFSGHLMDWNLPDYRQYGQLTGIIGRCKHSLLILTGDVHYGRIASSPLRSGAELIEIISSPMSLVDESAKGKWEEVPGRVAPAALAPAGLFTKRDFRPNDSHFLTLEFTRRGTGANLRVRYWPMVQQGIASPDFGKQIWEKDLV